jgi:hypothetical protein
VAWDPLLIANGSQRYARYRWGARSSARVRLGFCTGRAARSRAFTIQVFRDVTVRLTDEAIANGFGAVLPEQFGISVSGRGERI